MGISNLFNILVIEKKNNGLIDNDNTVIVLDVAQVYRITGYRIKPLKNILALFCPLD